MKRSPDAIPAAAMAFGAAAELARDTTTFSVLCPTDALPFDRLGPNACSLVEWWLTARGQRRAPARDDFDPTKHLPLVPNLILWGCTDGDFVCRLAGTQICMAAGRELRGMTMDEMHHGNPKVRNEFATVARDWVASYVERSMGWIGKDWRCYRRLLLPLSRDGERVDTLIGHFHFERS